MPNEEQIRYWNEQAGARWVALSDQIDFQLGPLGRLAMDRARIAQGSRVLDVGCGCGDTTIELGRRVGPHGRVVGIDVSAPMLELARARAAEAALTNVEFERSDAQEYRPPQADFDAAFSRFGVMFFEDPMTALGHLRELLSPGGRVTFVCWRALAENPWMSVPLEAAASHIAPPPAAEPTAPGPFAFAQRAYVSGLLEAAGYEAISCEAIDLELDLAAGRGLDAAVQFVLRTGLVARAVEQAGLRDLGPLTESLRGALSAHVRNHSVPLGSACWIFTAQSRTATGRMTADDKAKAHASDF